MSEYDPFRFIDETEEETKPKRNKKEEGLAIDKTHSKQEKSVDVTQVEREIIPSETQPKQRKPDITEGETKRITQKKQLDKKLELFKLEIFTKLDDLNRKIKILNLKDFSELDKICTAYIKQYKKSANSIKKKEGSKTIKTFEYAKRLQKDILELER